MNNRTLLVDSSYLLKRSFNGNKNSYTSSFGHIGGLYSYFTTLRKLIKAHNINKVVNFWDGDNGGILRYRIDEQYKANRDSKSWFNGRGILLDDRDIAREERKKQSILKQKIRIQQYAEELFLRQIMVDEIEADDLIAQYCIDNHKTEDILIFTNDRDFCQLLDLDIKILFGNQEQVIDRRTFIRYFPYPYYNALTMKIIEGDSSDNIHGIEGLKEKTLLKHFPDLKVKKTSVREVCIQAKKINEERKLEKKKPLKALNNLIDNTDRLKTNYQLVQLTNPLLNDEAIDELEQLKEPLSEEGRSSQNLYKLMTEDGFLEIYNSTFVNYVEPFHAVIMHEKEIYKKYGG